MSNGRYQALAERIGNEAHALRCVAVGDNRGTPVDHEARKAVSARFIRVKNVLMRQAREAFAQQVAS